MRSPLVVAIRFCYHPFANRQGKSHVVTRVPLGSGEESSQQQNNGQTRDSKARYVMQPGRIHSHADWIERGHSHPPYPTVRAAGVLFASYFHLSLVHERCSYRALGLSNDCIPVPSPAVWSSHPNSCSLGLVNLLRSMTITLRDQHQDSQLDGQ